MNDTRSIRARIHDSALKRVTRTFAATLADIFAETLQNARRAGATRVRVTLTGGEEAVPLEITVTDDGAGIADPTVLLSFGENGWNEKLVRREDAAGMGFLSLARRGCAVSSRPRARDGSPAPGWWVKLSPAHFLGEDAAAIRPAENAPFPNGTAVTFPAMEGETASTVRLALEAAARHYPLPVIFEHPPHTPSEGVRLERRAFLDGAVHVEKWRGLVFGVFKNPRQRFGLKAPDVNFFGLTVPVRLPEIGTAGGAHWIVAADVDDCPELEFVLPARKEAVETPFLAEMREAARLAIYRTLAAEDDPRPAFDDFERAGQSGIEIAPAPAELCLWQPALADLDHWREPPKLTAIGPDALIVACDPEPPEAQAFARAAKRDGLAFRLFAPDKRLEGYAWYNAIGRITGIHTCVTTDGQTHALEDYDVAERTGAPEAPPAQRPESIRIRAAIQAAGQPDRTLDLPADLAFAGEAWSWVGDALPLVTSDSSLEPHELASLLYDAYFSPSDDADADSWDRQRADFDAEALHLATRLLVSDDEARRRSIADAVRRELLWLIPRERGADIAVRGLNVTVTLGPLDADTHHESSGE
ncbi:MAG: ATP-binding protein [Gammaproteobacteria bacterium]|nr:ATP-binding protein [Gammaproteobacteria bacterium]